MAKSTGDTLEALVRKSAKALEPEGLRLKQTGAVFRGKIGPNGQAQGRIVSKGDLDFVGDYKGRAVSFDAKSTKAASFPLKNIKRHQVTIARNAHERGATAFFLVEFNLPAGPLYFALDWPRLAPFWLMQDNPGAPQSIPLGHFLTRTYAIKRAGNVLDLVGAVRAMQSQAETMAEMIATGD